MYGHGKIGIPRRCTDSRQLGRHRPTLVPAWLMDFVGLMSKRAVSPEVGATDRLRPHRSEAFNPSSAHSKQCSADARQCFVIKGIEQTLPAHGGFYNLVSIVVHDFPDFRSLLPLYRRTQRMQRVRGCSRIDYSHHASLTNKRIKNKPQYLAYSAYRRTRGGGRRARAGGGPRRRRGRGGRGGGPAAR